MWRDYLFCIVLCDIGARWVPVKALFLQTYTLYVHWALVVDFYCLHLNVWPVGHSCKKSFFRSFSSAFIVFIKLKCFNFYFATLSFGKGSVHTSNAVSGNSAFSKLAYTMQIHTNMKTQKNTSTQHGKKWPLHSSQHISVNWLVIRSLSFSFRTKPLKWKVMLSLN